MNFLRSIKFDAKTIGFSIVALVILAYVLFLPPPSQITHPHLAMVMLGMIICSIIFGFPIAFTLIGLGMLFGFVAFGKPGMAFLENPVFATMVSRTYGVMTLDVIIAVPLFIFMGYIVERSGIIDRLFRSLQVAMSGVPGALAVATILTCAMFAAATGIIGAVVTLMGLLVLPPMLKAGYNVRLSAGSIAAGGCLGILIPPSVLLILYGSQAGVSVVQLYMGAIIPGLMLAGMYIGYVVVRVLMRPGDAPVLPASERVASFSKVFSMLLTSFIPLALLVGSVLGSILFGIATPTEAAAVGALGAALLAAAYRRLDFSRIKESVFLTSRTTAMVIWLLVGSQVFSSTFAILGGQNLLESWVYSMDLSPGGFLFISQLLIFLLGWPLDWTVIIIIFVPIFLPMLPNFGIDPLFFGLLTAINLQTAFLSPPMAMSAYYLKGVAPPQVQLTDIFMGMIPFMMLQITAMVLLVLFPAIGLWLPQMFYQ
ncbi:MAG: C4-dicarboxylate ABC transporter [Proteobacteria bacterium]|nr:C4-dicarboxylate ABC transporter [Pseudomonadota bacterium]|tara:strand:- start:1022 stop:2470 length:1449 start_codon:yes stop_codon:yes gene_type:complete